MILLVVLCLLGVALVVHVSVLIAETFDGVLRVAGIGAMALLAFSITLQLVVLVAPQLNGAPR